MQQYGLELRLAYRSGDTSRVTTREFLESEAELERRGLLSKKLVSQIERGIVFIGMPLIQALASIDELREVDVLILDGHIIRSFQGPASAMLGSQKSFDTFVSCDGKTVTLFAAKGLITPDTYHQVYGSGRIRFQTNFPSDYWRSKDFRQRIRGNRVYEKPAKYADRFEHRWSLFSNNSGTFTKPSVWHATGANSYYGTRKGIDINDMMNLHIRRGKPVC